MAAVILGVWLLAAPAVLGVDIRTGAADVAHPGGAFVVVVAVLSLPRGELGERDGDWHLLTR